MPNNWVNLTPKFSNFWWRCAESDEMMMKVSSTRKISLKTLRAVRYLFFIGRAKELS